MKAISAIIATIMLLMISVSMVGVFYVFSSGIATTSTTSAGEQASQITKQLSSCMRIDNIYINQVLLTNCGKGVIENKSLVVMMDDVILGANMQTIQEGNSSVVNLTGLWQIPFGTHNLKISNGAAVAQNLVDVQPNKDGLVGSWSFNAGSGNIAADDSGNGNTGTLLPSGSEPSWVNGRFGKGLQFDGVNDYVDAGNIITSLSTFTFSFWIKINSFTNADYMTPFGQADAVYPPTTNHFTMYTGSSASAFGLNGKWTDGTSLEMRTNIPFSTGVWKHITVTYDGSTVKQYVDVLLLNQNSYSSKSIGNNKQFLIGKGYAYPGYFVTTFFNGTIDEVRIWNKSFTPDETVVMKQII